MSSFFFFSSRRRHTNCLSDWSPDVCSSDLLHSTRHLEVVGLDDEASPFRPEEEVVEDRLRRGRGNDPSDHRQLLEHLPAVAADLHLAPPLSAASRPAATRTLWRPSPRRTTQPAPRNTRAPTGVAPGGAAPAIRIHAQPRRTPRPRSASASSTRA